MPLSQYFRKISMQ